MRSTPKRTSVSAMRTRQNSTTIRASARSWVTARSRPAAAIANAGSTDTEKLLAAMNGLTFESPFGPISFRPLDHQSTMGAFVGRTAVKDGKGVMVDWRYVSGKDALPADDEVKRMRAAD